jgi:hypothetical protein
LAFALRHGFRIENIQRMHLSGHISAQLKTDMSGSSPREMNFVLALAAYIKKVLTTVRCLNAF